MKKFMKKVNDALTSAVISVKSALSNKRGEAYVDTGRASARM